MYTMQCVRRSVYIYVVAFYFASLSISFFTFSLGSALAKETFAQKTINLSGTNEEVEPAEKSELKEKHFHFIPNVFVDKTSEFSDGIKANLKSSVYEERKLTKTTDTAQKNDKTRSQEEPKPCISSCKIGIPLELQTKLKDQRDKFIQIVTSPYAVFKIVFNFFYSCIRFVFIFIVRSVHQVVSYFYQLTKKTNLFFYNLVVRLPYRFLRYMYYQCGSLIFFFSLPILFGLLGGILLAALSKGSIQVLFTYIFSPQLNQTD